MAEIATIPVIRRPYRDSFCWRETMRPLLKISCIFCVVLVFFCLAVTAGGKVIYVDDDGPADFNNIQAAINDANNGDTVVVAAGRYYESIHFHGKNISLTSTDPNNPDVVGATVIDGNGVNSVVTLSGTENSSCVLAGFTITNGRAPEGGGIYGNGTLATIEHNVIVNNSAAYGGGLSRCDGLIRNNTIAKNENVNYYNRPTYYGYGGGLYSCHGTIASNKILGNTAETGGGGMYIQMGHPLLVNCTFRENTALGQNGLGGGIFNNGGPLLRDCEFIANRAECGGGIHNGGYASITLVGCILSGNSAQGWGGGISNFDGSNPILTNCTVVGNFAPKGGGLAWVTFPDDKNPNNAQLTNCIAWDNRDNSGVGGATQICGGTEYVRYSCVQGGWPSEGNIDVDPLFVDIGYWDANGTRDEPYDDFWVNGDYHLKSQAGRWDENERRWTKDDVTSPCIDAGDPLTPIGLEPFPNGGRINMGAYGGTAEASKSYFGSPVCGTVVAGDINGDCQVDFLDFGLMASHWVQPTSTINSNSIVKDGVEYYVQTDKTEYRLGENVELYFRVSNLTDRQVNVGCPEIPDFNFVVEKDGEVVWRLFSLTYGSPWSFRLVPGGERSLRYNWSMGDANGNLVQPGIYAVVGVNHCAGVSDVRVPIRIKP